jgi:hypothetical protein
VRAGAYQVRADGGEMGDRVQQQVQVQQGPDDVQYARDVAAGPRPAPEGEEFSARGQGQRQRAGDGGKGQGQWARAGGKGRGQGTGAGDEDGVCDAARSKEMQVRKTWCSLGQCRREWEPNAGKRKKCDHWERTGRHVWRGERGEHLMSLQQLVVRDALAEPGPARREGGKGRGGVEPPVG